MLITSNIIKLDTLKNKINNTTNHNTYMLSYHEVVISEAVTIVLYPFNQFLCSARFTALFSNICTTVSIITINAGQ